MQSMQFLGIGCGFRFMGWIYGVPGLRGRRNGFFFWGNFAFWGNRFLENLGEIGLGEISSFKNLGETVWGNFMKN